MKKIPGVPLALDLRFYSKQIQFSSECDENDPIKR